MNVAVPGKTAGMAGKPFPAGNVQTWGRRSWNNLFWKRPPSSSSPLRCTRLQERSGCICFSLLLYELKREKKKDCKQTKSLHSQFVCVFLVPGCSFHSFLSGCLTLAAVCVQTVAGTMGWGRLGGCPPLQPIAPCFFRNTSEFIVF